VPLRFLRDGGGASPLTVALGEPDLARPNDGLIGEWELHGTAAPQSAALYKVANGFEYWTTDAGRFAMDFARGRIEVPSVSDEILREQRLHGMPMLLSFAHRGDFSLHAAAAEVDGRAVILAAPSKFGKTTLAFAFHTAGHRLLSEDLACVRPSTMELLAGPAVVRLRPDVFGGEAPAGTELVATRPDRIFLRLDAERRGSSAPVPIGGVFFLREGENVRVTRAASAASVQDLWHLGYRMPNDAGRAESFRQMTELATKVAIWNVERPVRLHALDATVAAIVDALS